MPRGFVNYHSAKIDNSKFKGYRWATDEFKPGISVLYGLRAKKGERGGRTAVASIRFSADKFSPSEAKAWLKAHDYSPIAFEKARGEKDERYVGPLLARFYELTTSASVGPAGKMFYYPSTDSIDPEEKRKKRDVKMGKGNRVIEAKNWDTSKELDDLVSKYSDKVTPIERSRAAADGTVALFKGSRKIFDGPLTQAVAYLRNLLSSIHESVDSKKVREVLVAALDDYDKKLYAKSLKSSRYYHNPNMVRLTTVNIDLVIKDIDKGISPEKAIDNHYEGEPFTTLFKKALAKSKITEGLDEAAKKNTIGPAIRSRINDTLRDLSTKLHSDFPLKQIFDACKKEGVIPIDEDGNEWEGFITGREGRTTISLKNAQGEIDNCVLVLTWYKHDTGRYEITVYLS
jgi:hypothetical protein